MKLFKERTHNDQKEPSIGSKSTTVPAIVDDRLLWNSFRKGSESAFIDIYNTYFQILYDFGRQYSGDPELVKDCIQEVFITIRIRREKLPDVNSIKAYLIKSIRNKILTEIRDTRKKQHTGIVLSSLNFLVTPCFESILINRQFNNDQIKKIQQSLSELSERQREAVYHFYYTDLGYEEIKTIMGFSSTRAVRNLVYKALSEIKKSFSKVTID